MVVITDSEKKAIKDAISEVELHTTGEIVPIVATRSDVYAGATWRIAIAFTLAVSGVLALFVESISPFWLVVLQVPFLWLGWIVGSIPAIERFAIHPKEMSEEVHQRAIQAFFNFKLHTTQDRTGILIFVSCMEHRVEILADAGVYKKLPPDVWQETVDELVKAIKKRQLADGLVTAIQSSGKILKTHFPSQEEKTNELCNDLVLVDM